MLWWLFIALIVLAGFVLYEKININNTTLAESSRLERAALSLIGSDEAPQLAEKAIIGWTINQNLSKKIETKAHFAALTACFLNKYYEIISPNGACCVGLKYLSPSEYCAGMLKIGNVDYWHICVFHDSDVVYVIDGSEGGNLEDNYPSIFHFLLDYSKAIK